MLCGFLGVTALAVPAVAADRFSAEAFEPTTMQSGSLFSVYGTRALPEGEFEVGSTLSYARSPITLRDSESDLRIGRLMSAMGTLSISGAYGIVDRFDVGVAVPVHYVGAGSSFAEAGLLQIQTASVDQSVTALGDVRVVPRMTLLERGADSPVGMAALMPMSLPTGDRDIYGGESMRVEPRLSLDWASSAGVLLAANAGYLVRERAQILNTEVDDAVRWGAGAEVPFSSGVSGLLEANGSINTSSTDAPTEGLVGLRLRSSSWMAQVAGGTGMVQGLTSPQYRLVAAVQFRQESTPPPPVPLDTDSDGVVDAADACPMQAEDFDGFQDTDGCPDLDDDGDQIANDQDRCLGEPEDRDGFEDADGCPDLDNDGDGILDQADRCADAPEDLDGFEDEDGCPELDNDQDGVPDAEDRCPTEQGTAVRQGCPPVAEVEPAPTEPAEVAIAGDQLELEHTVQFALGKAAIAATSLSLIDEITEVLQAHPELELVVIEGHSDDLGARAVNLRISQQRAEAVVEALVERGVARDRLQAKGIGPDRPLVANDSAANRAINRRVELHIQKRESKRD